MTPGTFLRDARFRAGLSIDDVALSIRTVPHTCARDRAEWLGLVEADTMPVTIDVGIALSQLLGFNLQVLILLVAQATGSAPELIDAIAATIRRGAS